MATTLAGLLRDELTALFAPLAAAGSPLGFRAMLESFGHTDRLTGSDPLRTALTQAAALVDELSHLDDAALATWDGAGRTLVAAADVFAAVRAVEQAITDPTLADQAKGLGLQIVGRLVALHLRTHHPRFHRVASLLTLIAPAEIASPVPLVITGSEIVRMPWADDTFRFDRAGDLVVRPGPTLRDAYFPNGLAHVADAYAAADLLLPLLGMAVEALGLRWYRELFPLDPPGASLTGNQPFDGHSSSDQAPGDGLPVQPIDPTPRLLRHMPRLSATLPGTDDSPLRFGIGVVVSSMEHEGGIAGAIVTLNSDVAWSETHGAWKLDFESDGKIPAFVIGPAGVTLAPLGTPQTGATGSISATLAAPEEGPAFVLGAANGSRLEVGGAQLKIETALSEAQQSLALSADVSSSAIVIAPGDGDGFLSSILPAEGLQAKFDLGLTWSNEHGLAFRGAGSLDATLPVGLSIRDVLTVPTIHLSLRAEDTGLEAKISASVGVSIGPVHALVDQVGIATAVTFPKAGGNLGVADLDLRFKPPNGLGLAIDASVVIGGGYLRFDPQQEEYSGMLELQIAETIAVKGIGVLTTRMPDGGKGYSLVVIIFAEGFAPIQLGLGFTLTGIGGLLAINRTFDEEALRTGLKNHTLDSVMFPTDPIRNASQILSNLNKVFPIANGHHLFGPMAQIAWGTPPLITADVGVVLEFGARLRLLILAQVVAILPNRENDLLRLQMDAIGVLDFDQGTAALDATLYDSRLLKKFVLTGDMAMRLQWEASPNFALAIGGLHPAFNPPPNFPKLERIALNLSAGDNPRIRCEAYFALTSNTVQFGARAELYAAAVGFSIQGEIGFDVLIQLDPFYFLADFYAQVQLKRGSTNLFKVRVEGALAGPRPLHIKGTATFEILWWDVSIRIDKTLIEGEKPPPPERVDVLPRLKEALGNPGNWTGRLPDGQRPMVTLRATPGATTDVLLHPLGTLTVKQGIVPLNLEISRFGQAAPAGARLFTISSVSLGGQNQTIQSVKDFFAPAQFFEMSDDEKLSRPSFEPLAAGVSLGSDEFVFTDNTDDDNTDDWLEVQAIEFETWIVDKEEPEDLYKLSPKLLGKQARFGAAGASDLRRTGKAKYRTTKDKYRVTKEGWSIVGSDDLSVQPAPGSEANKPASYSEAAQALRKMEQEDPTKAAGLKILRLSEVRAID